MPTHDLLDITRDYLQALSEGATGDRLASFYTSDVVQEEFPNRLVPKGAKRGLEDLLLGAERGRELMASQRFELLNAVVQGDRVAVEVQWTGNLRTKVAGLPEGSMSARFGVFLEFRDGKIAHQNNYDCFSPNEKSHDYFSWTMHADAGLRLGNKRSCFIAATTGVGLNSGTQSLGPGDWFRTETNLHLSSVCGPIAAGLSLRNIDDAAGTVAQALATLGVFFDKRQRFGVGAALAVTGYSAGGDYAAVYEQPFLPFDSNIRQTMLRLTFVAGWGAREDERRQEKRERRREPGATAGRGHDGEPAE
jgi:ketosteroid isomerase-like protein